MSLDAISGFAHASKNRRGNIGRKLFGQIGPDGLDDLIHPLGNSVDNLEYFVLREITQLGCCQPMSSLHPFPGIVKFFALQRHCHANFFLV